MSEAPSDDPRDFLIETEDADDHHKMVLTWSSDRSMIYFHRNGGTACLSPKNAEQLLRALLALLRGPFRRAITETALRMEQEEALRRQSRSRVAAPESPPPSLPKPSLEQL